MKGKLKVLISAAIVMVVLLTSVMGAFATGNACEDTQQKNHGKFKDIDENFWAYPAINQLTGLGIINGFPDNTFKPNEGVTRSQFASMLSKALDLTTSGNTQTFADVPPTSWDYKAIEASAKYLTGYRTSNGTLYFYGSKNAVREDMAVALVKALDISLKSNNGKLQQAFKDYNQITASLRDYVYTAYETGIMVGSGNKFNPQGTLTRAEAATLLLRALQKTEKVPVDGYDGGQKVPADDADKNDDAALSNIKYNSKSISGFDSDVYEYNVALPAGTTAIPVVTATVHDSDATAVVTQATALPGRATINVVAENGKTHKTYTVNFTVAGADDATLSRILVNGAAIPGFTSGKAAYNVILPAGTTAIPVVTATANDKGKATIAITQASALPGQATIKVTAADGRTRKTYTVSFTVAAAVKNNDATLSEIAFNGTKIGGFTSGKLAYNVILPAGTTAIPVVTATARDEDGATVVITQAPALPGQATIKVTAEDGTAKKTYTVSFTVAAAVKGGDATLSGLAIDGVALAGFDADTLAYDVLLPADTATAPVVTATVHDSKAAASIVQATGLPGTATIVVTAEDGKTQKTYTVSFMLP